MAVPFVTRVLVNTQDYDDVIKAVWKIRPDESQSFDVKEATGYCICLGLVSLRMLRACNIISAVALVRADRDDHYIIGRTIFETVDRPALFLRLSDIVGQRLNYRFEMADLTPSVASHPVGKGFSVITPSVEV